MCTKARRHRSDIRRHSNIICQWNAIRRQKSAIKRHNVVILRLL